MGFHLLNKTNLISPYQTKPLVFISNSTICSLNKPNHPYPHQTKTTISLPNPPTHFPARPNHNLLYPYQSIHILPLYNSYGYSNTTINLLPDSTLYFLTKPNQPDLTIPYQPNLFS